MNLETATAAARRLGFVLPTRKIVDAIYQQSAFDFVPQPLPAGPEMRSTAYYESQNRMIEDQAHSSGIPEGALVSGAIRKMWCSQIFWRKCEAGSQFTGGICRRASGTGASPRRS